MRIEREKLLKMARDMRPVMADRERAGHAREKGEKDYVTEVDLQVQSRVTEQLHARYPQVQMLAEEKDNATVDTQGDYWILDPVDGTSNLMHDFHHSALSLGYCEEGELEFGMIYNPFTDELFWAQRGKGAFLNDDPIHVSNRKTLEESLILFGTCPYHRERSAEDFELFRRVFLRSQDVRRLGSAALDLAYIACGRSDLFFERDLKPWDYAAGLILVEEAGGIVTDYCRKRPDLRGNSDIVAGNGITEQLFFRDFGDAL